MRLRLGLSTCPNDTFAFHALMARAIDWRACEFEFVLADVEELNERMLAGELDASKVSFHAALHAAPRWDMLDAGAALGFGVGPLLLASARERSRDRAEQARVLSPGRWTTAHLLWRLFHAAPREPEHVVFSAILPALERGDADLGLCIHEARFTWRAHGLRLVEDLGLRWERETRAPLPLGGIAVRADLAADVRERVAACVRDSIEWGLAEPRACLATMRTHAQEQADDVLWKHVELYVNAHTLELGELGRRGLAELATRAARAGVGSGQPLRIVTAPPDPEPRVFHVAEPRAVAELLAGRASYAPASLAGEGFVHLSRAAQLPGTLALHYATQRELVLLELERARVAGALRFERSRAGEPFPHLYRAIEPSDVVRAWPLSRASARHAEADRGEADRGEIDTGEIERDELVRHDSSRRELAQRDGARCELGQRDLSQHDVASHEVAEHERDDASVGAWRVPLLPRDPRGDRPAAPRHASYSRP